MEKLVMTGGHAATTALATFESMDIGAWDVHWIGSKRAVEGKSAITIEFKIFPKHGIRCHSLMAGRLQRKWTTFTLLSIIKIPVGFVHAFFLLLSIRPKVVVSFGGFAAFPVVFSSWILRIPVVLHEQTIAAGLANKYSSVFAKKIAISRKSSGQYFPSEKIVLTGNPVRKAFFKLKGKKNLSKSPVIYATGGSRGAQNFNKYLFDILPEIINDYYIIHQTGELDYLNAQKLRSNLPTSLRQNYEIHSTVSPDEVPAIFEKADIVMGRSGANTVAEVLASERPAIFVPIPWTQHNEQTKNAELAERIGLAKVLDQNTLNSKILLNTLQEVSGNWKKMSHPKNNKIRETDMEASEKLVELIESI